MQNLTLLEILGSFPGGVAKLSEQTRVSTHALYRLAAGKHRKKPVRYMRAVADAMRDLGFTEEDLWTAWESVSTLCEGQEVR